MECIIPSVLVVAIVVIIAIFETFRTSFRIRALEREVESLRSALGKLLVQTGAARPSIFDLESRPRPRAAAEDPAGAVDEPAPPQPDKRDVLAGLIERTAAQPLATPYAAADSVGEADVGPRDDRGPAAVDAETDASTDVDADVEADAEESGLTGVGTHSAAVSPAAPYYAEPSSPALPAATSPTAAPTAAGFELQLTTRVAIWLGALALFLAGAFLVKYTFDAGLLGPEVRIALGAAFGVALLGVGEFLRKRSGRIAEGLTAAGVADLYAVTLAALNLYHFMGPTLGFVLLAAITGLAIALSLRQGPFVALLGLVGGFVTPALIGAESKHPAPLFIYLMLLQGGIGAVSHRRRWWPLGLLAFIGGVVWVGLWMLRGPVAMDGAWLCGFLLLSLALWLRIAPSESRIGVIGERVVKIGASILSMLTLGSVVHAGGFNATDWGFVGLLGVGALILARRAAKYEPLPWLGALLAGGLLITWRFEHGPLDATIFPWVALGFGVLYGLGGYLTLWGAASPARCACLSVLGALGALGISYFALAKPPAGVAWGLICHLLAAAYAAGAVPLARAEARRMMGDAALAAILVAATTFVSLAMPIELDRRLIPVAWALEVPLLAIIFVWLRVAVLRYLAGVLASLAVVALVSPDLLFLQLGRTPIWNWLLYAYGVPAVSLAATAWIFHRVGEVRLSRVLQAETALLTFLLVTLEVRHFFHGPRLFASPGTVDEAATYVIAWLVLAILATLATRGATRLIADHAATLLTAFALLGAVAGPLALQNPLWTDVSVGALPIFNALLSYFGLPAILLFALAYLQRADDPSWFAYLKRAEDPPWRAAVVAVAGVVMFFALITLEVRQGFRGTQLTGPSPTLLETAAYVDAWLIVAIAAGFAARGVARRVAMGTRYAFGGIAILVAFIGLLLSLNPLSNPESVGAGRIVNWLLVAYGVPMLLAAIFAFVIKRDNAHFAIASGIVTLAMLFALVSLEVRQWYRGEVLMGSAPEGAELYTYSAAWTLLGLLLLGVGVPTRSLLLRWSSLVITLAAVGKVFLVDTANLKDLYRVFSLLGLGLSLMLLAFLYQRFVFNKRPAPASGDDAAGGSSPTA